MTPSVTQHLLFLCTPLFSPIVTCSPYYSTIPFSIRNIRDDSAFAVSLFVITGSRLLRDRFLLIKSRYLRCRCSVTCFNLDKLHEVSPLGVVVFTIGRILRCPFITYTIISYTRNLIILVCMVIQYPDEWIFDSQIFVIQILF